MLNFQWKDYGRAYNKGKNNIWEIYMKKDCIEIIKYGVAGTVSTAINLAVFYILSEAGIYYIVSNMISYYIAVVINFTLNNYFVFERQENKEIFIKLWSFVKLRTVSLAVDTIVFFILVSGLRGNKYVNRVFLSMVIIAFNFIWSKRNIFR